MHNPALKHVTLTRPLVPAPHTPDVTDSLFVLVAQSSLDQEVGDYALGESVTGGWGHSVRVDLAQAV